MCTNDYDTAEGKVGTKKNSIVVVPKQGRPHRRVRFKKKKRRVRFDVRLEGQFCLQKAERGVQAFEAEGMT